MIRCEDNSLYTGITTDPQRRQQEHSSGGDKAARYTRTHKAGKIEALWKSGNRSAASRLEYYIKTLRKDQKERLCADGDLSVLEGRLCCEQYTFVPADSFGTDGGFGR